MKRNTNIRRTYEEVQIWYNDHISKNITLQELSKEYNTDAGYQFKKFGFKSIHLNRKRRASRFNIHNDLKLINNEKDAYILGLWFADGYISNNMQAGLSLNKKDSDLLNDILNYISPEQTLLNKLNQKCLIISSMDFVDNLKSYGITSNKSINDYCIPDINKGLVRHFIRGYFDGDGTVYYDRKYLRFNICSITLNILNDIQIEFLESSIISNINTEIRENKSYSVLGNKTDNCKNMHRLFVRKKDDLCKLYKYLYDDSTIFLLRKKEIFEKYVNTEVNQ